MEPRPSPEEEYSIHTGQIRTFGKVDYVVFFLTLMVSAGIGVFYAISDRGRNTPKEFLLGGRKMKIIPVAMSLTVTFVSAMTLLGYPAEMYNYNTMFFWLSGSATLAVAGAALVFIPFFFRLGVTSTTEYLEMRFNKATRMTCSVIMIVHTLLYMALLLYAPSLALNAVTGINLWGCVAAMGLVATMYTSLGGMKAVLWTDTFQAGVIVAGLLATIIRGVSVQGGISHVWNMADNRSRIVFDDFSPDPRTRHSVWSMVVGAGILWLTNYGVNQSQVQRTLACPSIAKARIALAVNLVGLIIMFILSCLLGIVMFSFYADCDPVKSGLVFKSDQLVPLFVMDVLGTMEGMPGVFVSAVVSASLSSMSSGLNALSAITFRDIEDFGVRTTSEFKATLISKLLGYGLLAFALAWVVSLMDGVLKATYVINGVLSGPVFGVFTLGMFFPWANSCGALTGMFVSIAFSLWVAMGALLNKLSTPMTPTSVMACNWTSSESLLTATAIPTFNTTDIIVTMNATMHDSLPEDSGAGFFEPMYRMSYMWYTGLGMMVVWIVGITVSFISGATDPKRLAPHLTCPIVSTLVPCLSQSCAKASHCGVQHGGKNTESGETRRSKEEESFL